MERNYGLVGPKGRLPPGPAILSLFARLLAAASPRRADWILVREDGPAARGREDRRVFRMRLAGDGVSVPDFRPGQYVFVSFPARGILASPRPFTVSSPPSEGRWLEVYAKDSGDWSGRAKALTAARGGASAKGDAEIRVRVAGPYGRFSYLSAPGTGRFVFLAAGMGAAPFVSMLRFMADADRERRVLFLWGCRTREDLFAAEELRRVQERVGGFRFVPVLSHDPLWTGERGRVDREKLERIVPAFFGSRTSDFEWNSASYWLCGPPAFRSDLGAALRNLGVLRAAMHEERFRV